MQKVLPSIYWETVQNIKELYNWHTMVSPYRLNDRLGDDFIKEDTHVLAGS